MKKIFVLVVVVWSLINLQSLVLSQVTFPTRPVTIWVGFPAGGGTDIITRALAEGAGKSLGQKIVVMNKPGGAGTVCASLLAKEKPDGYTIGAYMDTPITRTPHLRDLDYDPFGDLSHIIRIAKWKQALAVRADSPFKKWEEVVDWAKKNPGQLVYGHTGVGATPHLGMVKLGVKEGFTFKSVPFAGDTPTVSALLGGHVMIAGATSLGWRSHALANTVRLLLIFESEGLDYAPDVPTLEKLHYDFEVPVSTILSAPKAIPNPIKETLEKAFVDGTKQETFRRVAKEQDLPSLEPLTGKALLDYLKKYFLLYEQFIKEAGIYKIEKK